MSKDLSDKLYIYSPIVTERLVYVADFLSGALALEVDVTDNPSVFEKNDIFVINYSDRQLSKNEVLYIQPSGLLFETGVHTGPPEVRTVIWQEQKVTGLYPNASECGFDLFSAIFYCISRIEEYNEASHDQWGRFIPQESLAYKKRFIKHPLVDEWLYILRMSLQKKGLKQKSLKFNFLLTVDVDCFLAYKARPMISRILSVVNGLKEGDAMIRVKQFFGMSADPYDVFDELHQIVEKNFINKPKLFLHLGGHHPPYDRSNNPEHPEIIKKIKKLQSMFDVGLHPSWKSSSDFHQLLKEKRILDEILQEEVDEFRQHFLKFTLPQSVYRNIEAGLRKDYSMGYSTIQGFRASTTFPFKFYDFNNEKMTDYVFYPFCWMDTAYIYHSKMNFEEKIQETIGLINAVKKTSGIFVVVFHNESLSKRKLFLENRRLLEEIIKLTN
ncbi:MAG: hypothetical protein KatS3mg034_0742 [Vicingaceae bacterium]|nr:MAG: hypothetical protein KatS3mg034_0742 [Vicingaceae bacterium]